MDSEVVTVRTDDRTVTDVTGIVVSFCAGRGDGLCHVFAPHATAGLALMETGAGSERDLEELLARLLPRDDRYRHRHGSPGHGADHLLPVLVPPSLTLPVQDGRPLLGTWQSVVLVDTNPDNPIRQLRCSWVGAAGSAGAAGSGRARRGPGEPGAAQP
jgi:secondary thiamine-phosphate synthase enzyme